MKVNPAYIKYREVIIKTIVKSTIFYYTFRVLVILLYPFWLLLGAIACENWDDWKRGSKVPFQKWNDSHFRNWKV